MDQVDRKILNIVQANFPITERPFQVLAEQVGMSEEEALRRTSNLKRDGVIRQIGPVFDSQKLGYKSTLVAMAVPLGQLDEVAQIVSGYPEVTHNYGREDHYNLWFTLIAPSQERIEEILHEIREKTDISKILNLPAKRLFKIKVEFNFDN